MKFYIAIVLDGIEFIWLLKKIVSTFSNSKWCLKNSKFQFIFSTAV